MDYKDNNPITTKNYCLTNKNFLPQEFSEVCELAGLNTTMNQAELEAAISGAKLKNGHINEAKAVEFWNRLRELIKDMTGYDPHELKP